MKVTFQKVILHNFLSFGDATISLDKNGFVLVSGVNENPVDNAYSNGAGKSSIWDAISYALTGVTIRGTKEIVNKNSDGGAFVSLTLTVDNKQFEITRYKNYANIGSDLKVIVNGEDKSGKGLKDSQQVLVGYLPDITSSLIGSVMILGQGMPQRFSNNAPSGRKEVLEKLTKSDYMIDDIKNRIAIRKEQIQQSIRQVEDDNLACNNSKSIYSTQLEASKTALELMPSVEKIDETIKQCTESIDNISQSADATQVLITNSQGVLSKLNEEYHSKQMEYQKLVEGVEEKYSKQITLLTNDLVAFSKKIAEIEGESHLQYVADTDITNFDIMTGLEKLNESKDKKKAAEEELASVKDEYTVLLEAHTHNAEDIDKKYNTTVNEINAQKVTLQSQYYAIDASIKEKENASDICPTCGQKLPEHMKIDISPLKNNLEQCAIKLKEISDRACELEKQHKINKEELQNKFEADKQTIIERGEAKRQLVSQYQLQCDEIYLKLISIYTLHKNNASSELDAIQKQLQSEKEQLSIDFTNNTSELLHKIKEQTQMNTDLAQTYKNLITTKEAQLLSLNKANLEKSQYMANKKLHEDRISEMSSKIAELENKILYNSIETDKLSSQLDLISKFENSTKRDFRGYLLSNIIEYIDKKAKEYCLDVFGTDKIEFKLDKNDIDIIYDGKEYSNLSGGERQKVDIIIQFALRAMLCNCLDFRCNMIVLDELMDFLDSKGCDRVLDLISRRLFDIDSVYIISHHKDLQIPYDKELIVVKSAEGISSIQE